MAPTPKEMPQWTPMPSVRARGSLATGAQLKGSGATGSLSTLPSRQGGVRGCARAPGGQGRDGGGSQDVAIGPGWPTPPPSSVACTVRPSREAGTRLSTHMDTRAGPVPISHV